MILEFKEDNYVDVEMIRAIRWIDEHNAGVVVFDGERIVINDKEDFDVVLKAYKWLRQDSMYNRDLKKGVS